MNSKELENSYQNNNKKFHKFLDNIKKKAKIDIYSIINTTLIKNPYNTKFPKKFFAKDYNVVNKTILFLKSSIIFYAKQYYLLITYFMSFLLFKIYHKKKIDNRINYIGIDIFFLVDNIIKDADFNEKYFTGVYEVLEKFKQNYLFMPRLYNVGKNPFKLIKLFKILNNDKRNFLFEFEMITFLNFIKLFFMIFLYPFKTLRLIQKENTQEDKLFNSELIKDIGSVGFDAFTRYIYGQNIAKYNKINKIYSWSEFQVVERAFNYGIRKENKNINLVACQFYLNYEIYFNAYVDDIDYDMLCSPHKVLVNGSYYIKKRKKVKYNIGVSLRYRDVFIFDSIQKERDVLLLGSYIVNDTQYMIDSITDIDNIVFKSHPVVDIKQFNNLSKDISITNENIYELFKNTKLVIGTASGTSVEAVACGISVIIIASLDNLTANPLVKYGKGEIWDIAFSKDDVKRLYNELIEYRENNIEEIKEIASWYKDNFFIEPTEENIVKAFELEDK